MFGKAQAKRHQQAHRSLGAEKQNGEALPDFLGVVYAPAVFR